MTKKRSTQAKFRANNNFGEKAKRKLVWMSKRLPESIYSNVDDVHRFYALSSSAVCIHNVCQIDSIYFQSKNMQIQ